EIILQLNYSNYMTKNFITYLLSVLAGIVCFLFILNWVLDEYGYIGAILLPLILVSIFLIIRKMIK
ncbi:MAG: hypothetical protein EBT29_01115, partial [Proteobacteria bacterium]|nr:hypothetical protein [Candidatus Fonsibacter sp. PEL4]